MFQILNRYYKLAAVSVLLAACSTVSVTTDYDHAAQFEQYKTYMLLPSTDKIGLSPSSQSALEESLRSNLAAHGIYEARENADLHVVSHVSTQEQTVVFPGGGGPYVYGRYGMWAGGPYYADVSQYTEGTLILDFVDAKTRKLVFRGTGTDTVSDPETNAKRVREAVAQILEKFPKPLRH
ncbi:DUF4136 domain-containing protein [Methylomonas sp. MgM2]